MFVQENESIGKEVNAASLFPDRANILFILYIDFLTNTLFLEVFNDIVPTFHLYLCIIPVLDFVGADA
jgi:hypothetical protein